MLAEAANDCECREPLSDKAVPWPEALRALSGLASFRESRLTSNKHSPRVPYGVLKRFQYVIQLCRPRLHTAPGGVVGGQVDGPAAALSILVVLLLDSGPICS